MQCLRREVFSADASPARCLSRKRWILFPGTEESISHSCGGLQVWGGGIMAQDRERPLFGRQSKVMTVGEVSEYLHVHPSTIYRLIKRRKIPAFRIGSDWRFNVETIDKWRAEMEGGAPESRKGRS